MVEVGLMDEANSGGRQTVASTLFQESLFQMMESSVDVDVDEDREEEGKLPLKSGFHQADLEEVVWVVPERYCNLEPIGIGTFGTVW